MQLTTIGLIGSLAYYLLLAIGHREMAALLRLVCYTLAASTAIQLLLGVWEQINSSTMVKAITWLATKLGGM
jgi:hypothetical protein